jgi:hypothetical protein
MDHWLAGAAGEGLPELRHVADNAVHAIAPVGMRIGLGAIA